MGVKAPFSGLFGDHLAAWLDLRRELGQGLPVNDSPLTMIAAHAHPDDESSKGGATMAKYAAEGIRVVVATFTGGERGDVLNPKFPDDRELLADLPAVRRREMAQAAAILGVEQRFLGFVDSGLPEGDPLPPLPEGSFASLAPEVAAEPLVELIRQVRPQVVTTYDPSGGYPHPDHVQTHRATVRALELAADPAFRPDLGEPFTVHKIYYDQAFSLDRIKAIHQAMTERGIESPYDEWLRERPKRQLNKQRITTQVRVPEFFSVRDAALRAHASQVDPDGWFFVAPRDIEAEVWPHEDFELVSSTVPVTIPEDDLFAGLR